MLDQIMMAIGLGLLAIAIVGIVAIIGFVVYEMNRKSL